MRCRFNSLFLAAGLLVTGAPAQAELTLAVAAPAGERQMAEHWQSLGDYLATRLGEPVTVKVLNPRDLRRQAQAGQLHLVVTPSTQAVYMRDRLHGNVLATVHDGEGVWQGGVLVARRDSPLRTGRDLAGKRIIMRSTDAGGDDGLLLTYYLFKQGLDAARDLKVLAQARSDEDLVAALRQGTADAAYVPTGVMGRLARGGKVHLDDYVIIDRQMNEDYPLASSTNLYPQWCVTSLATVGSSKAYLLQNALLEYRVQAGQYRSASRLRFAPPAPLDSTVTMLKQLSLEPYGSVALSP